MQIYLVSYLLRANVGRVGFLFYLIVLCTPVWSSEVPDLDPIEKDSLFSLWNKTKTTWPTLIYQMTDFNDVEDQIAVESSMRTYGVGGISIPNGGVEDVSKWIKSNYEWNDMPILHMAAINKIFELPFDGLANFPNQFSVECYSNDSLVYRLGLAHADVLQGMGIGLVHFSYLPDYYSPHELHKVREYLNGLRDGHVSYFFTGNVSLGLNFDDLLNESKVIDVRQVDENGLLDKKNLKNYRKGNNSKQIIIDHFQTAETSRKQIEQGVGLTFISKQTGVEVMLLEGIQKKRFYRQHVKNYYNLLYQIERQVEQENSEVNGWDEIKNEFEYQDVSLVQDSYRLVPIQNFDSRKIYTLSEGNKEYEMLVDRYIKAVHFPLSLLNLDVDSLLNVFPSDALIMADLTPFKDEIDFERILKKCDSLNAKRPVINFYCGNSQYLKFKDIQSTILWSPNSRKEDLSILVQMAFGAIPVNGVLPGYFQADQSLKGEPRAELSRLGYANVPSDNIDFKVLERIDTLVENAIENKMMPGCQIMMVKDGQVVWERNYGHVTYDSLMPVSWNHVYDIASVTKTVATVPAVMHDVEEGEISLTGHLGDYLSEYDSTGMGNLSLDDILTHQSGLKSYIPFWRKAAYVPENETFLYKQKKRRRKVNYLSVSWQDSIQSWIMGSKYNSLSNGDGSYRYLYSDLGFMMMKDLVEENCSCPFDHSVDELIYHPMGMDHTTFNPLDKFSKEQIVPTEMDKNFREELLQGVVHDKNAALLDGVSGHAGLFSNANDLAKYMQMILQGGYYGGERYFSDSVVHTFVEKKNQKDRRAMGWDKPNPAVGNASQYATDSSFGHSGFTGTLIWADPAYDMIYIFLSNRIYPDPQNYKLIESNTRTKIHDLMYKSFLNAKEKRNDEM